MKNTFTLIAIALTPVLYSQTSIPLIIGTPYQQDFNTLLSTGNANWDDTVTLGGWYATENNIYADDGNDVFGGRLHSYGGANSSERALGAKSFSSLSGVEFGVRMKNNGNNSINFFQIGFRGEQWRQNTNSVTMKFYYQVNAPGISSGTWTPVQQLDFPPLHTGSALALDGNLSANDTSFLYTLALTLNAGQEVWFKWEIIGNSSSPGLAIDDLEIIPYTTTPTSVASVNGEIDQPLTSYYDPYSNTISANYYSDTEEDIVLELYNSLGSRLAVSSLHSEKGPNRFLISAEDAADGICFLLVRNNNGVLVNKFLIQK